MMELCNANQVRKWFDECKTVLDPVHQLKQSKKLYDIFKKRNLHDYLQLRIEEGHFQEVCDTLSTIPQRCFGYNIDDGHNLTRQLVDVYPLEICDRYWKECEMLCMDSNKKKYIQAGEIMLEIYLILKKYKFSENWEMQYATFHEKHKRKSTLMKYINAEEWV